jgi:hypothetical protein
MRKKQDDSLQLSLWSDEQSQNQQEIPTRAAPVQEARLDQPEIDLLTYSRDNLKSHGPHDHARREKLRLFAQQRGYKEFHYTNHGKYDGYTQHFIEDGESNWQHFLGVAVSFDIYCCFIQAYAPHPLSFYLQDAELRGEIAQLEDKWIWRPKDHKKPRSARWIRPD